MNVKKYAKLIIDIIRRKKYSMFNPYKLTFAVTYNCNSRCRLCNIWKKVHTNELTLAEIKDISRNYNKFRWLNITGGEPYLRDDLPKIVEIFNKYNNIVLFNITTNGYLTDRIIRYTKKIASLDIPKIVITVSIDGRKEIHDYLRGIDGAWDMAVKTYTSLLSLKNEYRNLDVFIGFTLSRYNIGEYEKLFTELKKYNNEISYSDIHVNIVHFSSHYYGNKTGAKRNDLDILEEINRIKNIRGIPHSSIHLIDFIYLSYARYFLYNHETPLRCQAIKSSIFLDPQGNVYPCTIYSKILGNVRSFNYDIFKILQSDVAKNIYHEIQIGRCPHCWTPCEAYPMILNKFLIF